MHFVMVLISVTKTLTNPFEPFCCLWERTNEYVMEKNPKKGGGGGGGEWGSF